MVPRFGLPLALQRTRLQTLAGELNSYKPWEGRGRKPKERGNNLSTVVSIYGGRAAVTAKSSDKTK